jgi:hypothetical protein
MRRKISSGTPGFKDRAISGIIPKVADLIDIPFDFWLYSRGNKAEYPALSPDRRTGDNIVTIMIL